MGAAKKRKIFRKEARKMYGATMEVLAEKNSKLLKPKPRWIPLWVWIRLLSIFIYIRK